MIRGARARVAGVHGQPAGQELAEGFALSDPLLVAGVGRAQAEGDPAHDDLFVGGCSFSHGKTSSAQDIPPARGPRSPAGLKGSSEGRGASG